MIIIMILHEQAPTTVDDDRDRSLTSPDRTTEFSLA